MLGELFHIAFDSIRHRRMRSWLTMVGIFIGIAAVVALISLGQGLTNAVNKQFDAIGADKLIIQPKGSFGPPGSQNANPLTISDRDAIRRVPGVSEVAGMLAGNARVEFKDQLKFYQVYSLPEGPEKKLVEETSDYELYAGRRLQPGDSSKVMLGYAFTADKIFSKNIVVGDKVAINGKVFDVVGIWQSTGNPYDDRSIFMMEDPFKNLFDTSDRQDFFIVRIAEGKDMDLIASDVKRALRKNRGLKEGEEDFTVQTPKELMQSFNDILLIVQVVLIGIAGISLVVGGVGIANTMYTAVLERTKEIGIMKAIGARNSHIMLLFLFESGLLGLVGGAIGVGLGMGLSKMVEWYGVHALGTTLLQAYFPWYLIVGALLFSFGIGAAFGMLPARHAAQQKPVDALRYE